MFETEDRIIHIWVTQLNAMIAALHAQEVAVRVIVAGAVPVGK